MTPRPAASFPKPAAGRVTNLDSTERLPVSTTEAPTAPPSVVQALAAVMADVQHVGKDGRNSDQGYMFRGVDGVMNAVGPALRKHGVVILPVVEESSYRDVRTSRDKPAREVTVRVRYVIHGPGGDTLEGVSAGESMDFGDKGTPKAMSVAFRTFLLQALCIPTHEPDPNEQTYEREPAAQHARRQPSPGRAEPATEVDPWAAADPKIAAQADGFAELVDQAKVKEDVRAIWEDARNAGVLGIALGPDRDHVVLSDYLVAAGKRLPAEPVPA